MKETGIFEKMKDLLRKLSRYLFGDDQSTPVWRRAWTVTWIICFACIALSNQYPAPAYAEFMPSSLLCEAMLVFLCLRYPFSSRQSFLRLAILPTVGIWIPWGFRLLSTAHQFQLLRESVKKYLGDLSISIAKPGQAYVDGAAKTAWFCLGSTVVVLITSLFFGSAHLDIFEAAQKAPENSNGENGVRYNHSTQPTKAARRNRGRSPRLH